MNDLQLAFFLLTVLLTACTSTANGAPSIVLQCASLARFFASRGGSHWVNGNGWQSFTEGDESCCSWFGIKCDQSNTSVVEIRLPNNGVVGSFPPEWATELPSLAILELSGNRMMGTLPDAFASLSNLTHLLIERNEFNGTLPESWSTMKSLFRLEMSYNRITGTIPNSWANIRTFKWFYIGHNFITGGLPRLRTCGLLLCGNTGISQNLDEMNWSTYNRSDCAAGTSLFLVGLNLSGSVPCLPFVNLLDISYTDVGGSVPCCPGMEALILDGTSVSDWYAETTPLCVSPTMTRLSASYSKLSTIPMNLASRFPNLRDFAVRDNGISQALPQIPSTIEVLDLSKNAIVAPTPAFAGTSTALNLSLRFRYLDLATTSVAGITLLETPLQCGGATLNATCATVVSVFRAYGSGVVRDMNPPVGQPMAIQPMPEENIVTPPVFMVSGKRLVFHVVLDFINIAFSGQYRVTISVASLQRHLQGLSNLSPAQVKSPAPEWNHSFYTIGATPAGFAMFDGLNAVTLWYGVDYQVDVTFLYKPVLRRGPPPRQVSSLQIEVPYGTIHADPCVPASLYGVPLTPVCAACPVAAICNGTSTLLADGPVWRQSTGVLPFYDCENGGCTTGGPRSGTECADGATGPLCSNCVAGYGIDSTGNCVPCSSSAWNWSVFVIGAIVLTSAATFAATNSVPISQVAATNVTTTTVKFHASAEASPSTEEEENAKRDEKLRSLRNAQAALAVKRLQSHFGIFAIIGRTVYARDRSSVSVVLQTLQQAASQISLRSISFVNCIFPDLNAITQFQVVLCLIPILLLFELLFVRWRRGRWAVVAVCTATTLLLYDSAINIALQLIPADEMPFYDATQYTVNRTGAFPLAVISTLSLDRRINVDSSVKQWQSGAYAWLVLFGIGFPLTVCACYVKLTSWYGGQYATDNLGFLTNKYRQKRWYWEEAVMVRKFGLAVAVTALRNYPLAQMQAIIAVLMLYVVGLEWQVPFSSPWMHQAERTSCYSALLVANVLMAKGSLQSSLVDQVESVQKSAYTIFGAALQVISVFLVVVFLYMEWHRSRDQILRAGSAAYHLHDGYEMAEGSDTSSTENVYTPRRLNLARLENSHAIPVNELLVYAQPIAPSSAKEEQFEPPVKPCEL